MNILFITCGPLGDTVLTTGLLSHLVKKYPNSRVTIACGPLGTSLFEGLPQCCERIIPLVKQKRHGHWIKLWRRVITTRWDIVIDMRNSAVSRLIFAKERHIKTPNKLDKTRHWVEQNADVMALDHVPSPRLWFSDSQMTTAKSLINTSNTKVIGVGPTATWPPKTWPAENFITVLKTLTAKGGTYEKAKIAVFGAPGEEDIAAPVINAFPDNQIINLVGACNPGTAAAALSLCNLYIGNDSGLMHCAAAAGTPTCGLFGPTLDQNYRPWGEHCTFVRTPESFDELTNIAGFNPKTFRDCLMATLTPDMVLKEIESLRSRT